MHSRSTDSDRHTETFFLPLIVSSRGDLRIEWLHRKKLHFFQKYLDVDIKDKIRFPDVCSSFV